MSEMSEEIYNQIIDEIKEYHLSIYRLQNHEDYE